MIKFTVITYFALVFGKFSNRLYYINNTHFIWYKTILEYS